MTGWNLGAFVEQVISAHMGVLTRIDIEQKEAGVWVYRTKPTDADEDDEEYFEYDVSLGWVEGDESDQFQMCMKVELELPASAGAWLDHKITAINASEPYRLHAMHNKDGTIDIASALIVLINKSDSTKLRQKKADVAVRDEFVTCFARLFFTLYDAWQKARDIWDDYEKFKSFN